MNIKYFYITIILSLVSTIILTYLMLSNNLEHFIYLFKWFMRTISPFIMIYLIYIGMKK